MIEILAQQRRCFKNAAIRCKLTCLCLCCGSVLVGYIARTDLQMALGLSLLLLLLLLGFTRCVLDVLTRCVCVE